MPVALKTSQKLLSSSLNAEEQRHLKKQMELLRYCLSKNLDLATELKKIGWSYDDLQYEINSRPERLKKKVRSLADFTRNENGIPVVSFFSGAGGLDLGFEAAGFKHTALFENNEIFCNTLRLNRPEWTVFGPPDHSGDVSDVNQIISTLETVISSKKSFEGVFIGGPPCQPFSIAANQRFSKSGKNFKRVGFAHKTNGNLLFNYIDLICHFRPKVFLIENVPGLVEVDGGKQLQRAYTLLERNGYRVNKPNIVIAANHHVPQQRVRLFIMGSRKNSDYADLIPSENKLACSHVFDCPTKRVENHITREHSAESVIRYMALDYGQRDQLGRVDRLDPLFPSKTVIAGGTNGGGRSHLHPYFPRTLSVRESARLQTFPDTYIFTGPVARQFTQVGNAVPPVLAAQIATSLFDSYFNKGK